MKHKRTRREKIVAEYMAGETTYRELGTKYGYGAATIYRWVKEAERDRMVSEGREQDGEDAVAGPKPGESVDEELKRLRRELRDSQLYGKLLNAMIDIAEEDLGVDIRKKRGSGR